MAAALGLAPGFRFEPKDEEVVAHYLLRRIRDQPLPVGDILEDDPLSAPPWILLEKYGRKSRKRGAFFFAAGQAMNGKGSRQKRSCAGGGTWEGQGKRKRAKGKGSEGEKLSVVVRGEVIEWQMYALNFHQEGIKGSSGWVMHEYSITAPPDLAESPLRVYRIRFSGHGKNAKNAKKRKKDDVDWGSDEEEEDDDFAELAAIRGAAVAEFAGEYPPAQQHEFVSEYPPAQQHEFVSEYPPAQQPESVSSYPLVAVDVANGNLPEWTNAGAGSALAAATSVDQDLPALVDGGDDWNNFMRSMQDLLPDFDLFSGAADAA